MVIATAAGDVYESEFHQTMDEPMPKEAPLKITVGGPKEKAQEVPEQTASVGWQDVYESFKNDISKLGEGLVDAATAGPKLLAKMDSGEVDPYSPEAADAVAGIALNFGMGGISTAPMREGAGMFGGRLGAETRAYLEKDPGIKKTYDDAVLRLHDGENPYKVYEETGVHESADGHFKFEIPDNEAKLKTENLTVRPEKYQKPSWTLVDNTPEGIVYESPYSRTLSQSLMDMLDGVPAKPKGPKKVGDILDHPELYRHYPDAAKIPLQSMGFDMASLGLYHPDRGSIGLAANNEDGMLSTLLHEVNHYIQHQEGFARGGSPDEFYPKTPLYDKVKKDTTKLQTVYNEVWKEVKPHVVEFQETFNKKIDEQYKLLRQDYRDNTITFEQLRDATTKLQSLRSYYDPELAFKHYIDANDVSKLSYGDKAMMQFLEQHYPDVFDISKTYRDASKMISEFEDKAHRSYTQLWGEYESRAVQRRQFYNEEELRGAPHWDMPEFHETYPEGTVPAEAIKEQWNRGAGKSMSSNDPAIFRRPANDNMNMKPLKDALEDHYNETVRKPFEEDLKQIDKLHELGEHMTKKGNWTEMNIARYNKLGREVVGKDWVDVKPDLPTPPDPDFGN